MALGIDYATGELLVEPIEEESFGQRLQEGLSRNADEVRARAHATSFGVSYKQEVELGPIVDPRDPRAAGWTFLVNGDDPEYAEIVKTIRPLAELRGMADPRSPLEFHQDDDWLEWLFANYSPLDTSQLPHYILIVGGPNRVPFHFQAFLDTSASVGRVDLTLEDLASYIQKLIRLENAEEPVTERKAVLFATDHGIRTNGKYDPTYFSRRYMVEPLADHLEESCGLGTEKLLGEEATKDGLLELLRGGRPALVYTASHGMGAPKEDLETQKAINGAIVCRRTGGERTQRDSLFSAEDVPMDEPFLEGGVVFQFACFGYGTPAESDFMHWLGSPQLNSEEDFVSALPKKLLANPRGPVAFIGHVDLAWLHGFDDPASPGLTERWHKRISTFVRAVTKLAEVEPVGRAMADMNDRYSATNAILTATWDKLRKKRIESTPEFRAQLASTFITRSDAQNYMVFGDPAVRLRIPD